MNEMHLNEQEMIELKRLTDPLVEWLKERHDPFTIIKIGWSQTHVLTPLICIDNSFKENT